MPGGDVTASVTALMQGWANSGSAVGAIGLRATNEASNLGWKRFLSADSGYGPTIWYAYNSVPSVPTALKLSDSPRGTESGYAWTSTLTPTLSATLSDPDGSITAGLFEVIDKNGQIVPLPAVQAVPSNNVASIKVPTGTFVDGGIYYWRVRATDDRATSAYTPWFQFGVDATAPIAPAISSAQYTTADTWTVAAGTAGTFTFTAPASDYRISGFRWALDKAPDPNQTAPATSSSASITLTPAPGRHVLRAQAVDWAGNVSGTFEYRFNAGRAALVTPVEGARVVRKVRLGVTTSADMQNVTFQWRRGPDSPTFQQVPFEHLATSSGIPWTHDWRSLPSGSGYTTWDVGQTLGFQPGPVQVRAVVSDGNQQVHPTGWTTLTVDPDADGAATTTIGPGAVNLLTGDHYLSATDVEEFGLSVVRAASSRDTDAGYQLQADKLTTDQQTGASTAGYLSGYGAYTYAVTERFHTGTTSIKVIARPGNTNGDTYTSVGGDVGTNALGLKPGRSYRFSGWVYVPSTGTGVPAPKSPRGLRMTLFTGSGNGIYAEPSAPGGTASSATNLIVNAWQRVTFDATIPANTTEAFLRLYNGYDAASGQDVYWDDISVRELWSPFGPEWSAGTVDAASGTAFTHVSKPYADVAAVHVAGGGEIWFTSGNGTTWFPQPGAEDLTLTALTADAWRLTALDGTVTDFARPAGALGDYPVTTSSPTVLPGQTRHVYRTVAPSGGADATGVMQLYRVVAPIEPGVDGWPTNSQACTTAVPARGCEVLEYEYATLTTAVAASGTTAAQNGSYLGRVSKVLAWTWNGTAMVQVPVVEYQYDAAGRLRTVHDPRLVTAGGSPQRTTYEYDATGRVTSVGAPGEFPYRFEYGLHGTTATGSGDVVDHGTGRLLTVTRASLLEGSRTQAGPDNVTRIVYGVPTTRAGGGPYDLGPAQLATWAQTDGPTDATAVFGPQDHPSSSTATLTTPGADGYRAASVHYLNASGLEVNTASPAGPRAPVEGFIDTVEYDHFGHAVRTLDATNRLLALKKLPGAQATLDSWGIGGKASVELAQLFDSRTTYSPDGVDVLTQLGPAQQLAVANEPNVLQMLRPLVTHSYDEGKPDGAAYHLVTSTTSAGKDPFGPDVFDAVTTSYGYNPVDGADPLGPTSGWVHKQATTVTVNSTSPDALTARVLYDDRGRPVSSRKPGSTGSDAATTVSVFYTAGANAVDAACGARPEWAGQPCVTRSAGPVTGHDAARAATQLPVKRVTAYNAWGSPTEVTETATGPVNGSTVALSRTTTTTYDAADRVVTVALTGTGSGVGAAIQSTHTLYDPVSGDVTAIQSVNGATVTAAVTKQFDTLGRLTSYTDADGATTTTRYNRYGNPVQSAQTIAGTTVTTTYAYDAVTEPRGFVTSMTDSVAGTITASWGPDGQLESEQLPGGLVLQIGYDPARVPVSRTYGRDLNGNGTITDVVPGAGPDDPARAETVWKDAVVENHRGQWLRHDSTTGQARYTYDALGRLTSATDRLAMSEVCTTRSYGFAGSARSNRTQFAAATAPAAGGAACPAAPLGAATATYDSADRLVSTTSDGSGQWVYDPFGRTVAMPTATGSVTNAFYVNDLVQQQTQPGASRTTWTLDPLHRRTTNVIEEWVNGAWANSATKVSHYANDSDEPSWIAEDATLPSDVTRYVSGVEGDIAITTSTTGDRELQLVDLHGDVVGTVPIADGAAQATWEALRLTRNDEFGNPVPLTGAGATTGPPARYGWLGAAQRSAEALGGVILMGVRLYSPTTGRFLSVDPVPGGSANAYDYCNADPVNCTDLAGTFSFKGLLSAVAVVGEVASFIPGPIGAAAAGISAVAYAAQGNTSKAIEMGVTAAAQLVGAGAVVRVAARAINVARTAGQGIVRAAPRLRRAANTVRSIGHRGVASCAVQNSFTAGTLVVMADGSLQPIEQVDHGDLVLSQDPLSGAVAAEPVISPIIGFGARDLVQIDLPASTWIATTGHPFWVVGKGWTEAGELSEGNHLLSGSSTVETVTSVRELGVIEDALVFNLHVGGSHTYFVAGEFGSSALVHNCPAARNRPFSSAARAVIELAKEARGRITIQDARTLDRWRKEAGLPGHGPMRHPARPNSWSGRNVHIKVNGLHIKVTRGR